MIPINARRGPVAKCVSLRSPLGSRRSPPEDFAAHFVGWGRCIISQIAVTPLPGARGTRPLLRCQGKSLLSTTCRVPIALPRSPKTLSRCASPPSVVALHDCGTPRGYPNAECGIRNVAMNSMNPRVQGRPLDLVRSLSAAGKQVFTTDDARKYLTRDIRQL